MKKRKIGIVVDSTTGSRFKNDFFADASIVDLTINVADKSYIDGELSNEDILKFVDKKIKVQTSQPSPESFLNAFKEQLDLGYEHVICLTISKGLSGTINSANLAKDMIVNDNIIVIDSKTVGPGVTFLLEVINQGIEQGLEFTEVINKVNQKIDDITLYFSIEQLGALVAGGRLSKFQATIGNILKIKPILNFTQGSLSVVKKVRGVEAIYHYLAGQVKEAEEQGSGVVAKVTFVDNHDKAKKLIKDILEVTPSAEVKDFGPISAVVATHLGYSGLGVLVVKNGFN